MTAGTITTVYRGSFSTLDDALIFARALVETQGTTGGATVQLLAGSARWPDPAHRYRVTVSVDIHPAVTGPYASGDPGAGWEG